MSDDKKRIRELRKQLKAADAAYHGEDAPTMSDADYDTLMRELQDLEAKQPQAADAKSPSQTVGSAPSGRFPPFKHPTPMRSLSNAFSAQEVEEFLRRVYKLAEREDIAFSAELKLDGIAVNLHYQDGRLTTAATRGDGDIGEAITDNVLTLPNMPRTLKDAPAELEVRGEVVMTTEDFIRLNDAQNAIGKKTFANPRNAAAGSLRQLDSSITASRPLRFYAHGIGGEDGGGIADTHTAAMKWLEKRGFTLAAPRTASAAAADLLAYHEQMQTARADLPFAVDGVVYKVDEFAMQKKLGSVTRAPRYAVAYKFSAETATTIVQAIDMQVGRTGVLTPVARLQPATVGGVVVSNATLHNIELIAEKDVRVGDYVEIRRAGDVIPEVIRVLAEKREKGKKGATTWQPPNACTSCAGALRRDGRFLRCDNRGCPGRQRAAVSHFVSRNAMDIEGVGGVLLDKLFAAGHVRDAADLYQLNKEQLLSLELIADLSADNILAAINASRRTTLQRFLFALGISQVGEAAAAQLAGIFGTLDNLRNAPLPVYAFVPDVGGETAAALTDYFKDATHQQQLQRLRQELQWEETAPPAASRQQPLEGFFTAVGRFKTFVEEAHREALPTGLGKRAAAQLAAAFDDLPAAQSATVQQLTDALGGNEKLAARLHAFFADPYYREVIDFLHRLGFVWNNERQADDTRPLAGKVFVLTGTLDGLTRSEAKKMIEAAGGSVSSAISGSTDYLLAGSGGGSKLKKAEQLSVTVLSQDEWRKMLGDS